MADPFNLFSGNDDKTSSTIDDDFDAMFGSIGGDSASKEDDDDLDDLLKPNKSEPHPTVNTEPTNPTPDLLGLSTSRGDTSESSVSKVDSDGGGKTLLDFGDSLDGKAPTTTTTASISSTTKPLTLNKDKLFSFEDDDPGLDDVLLPASAPKSSKGVDSNTAVNGTPQQPHEQEASSGSPDNKTVNNDSFDDIFATKPKKPTHDSEVTSSFDGIFAPKSSSCIPETDNSMTDLFAPKNNTSLTATNNKRKSDVLDDLFGRSPPGNIENMPRGQEDIFFESSESHPKSKSLFDEDPITTLMTASESKADASRKETSLVEEKNTDDNHGLSTDAGADLLADLPACSTTSSHTPVIPSHTDSDKSPAVAQEKERDSSAAATVTPVGDVIVDAKKGRQPSRMDQDQGEITGEAIQQPQAQAVPDILDFLGDATCPDLPDISTLESSDGKTGQLDLIDHPQPPSPAIGDLDAGDSDDVPSNKRDHSMDSEHLEDEVDAVEPTKPKKKKEEDDDDHIQDGENDATLATTNTSSDIKLSVTSPSFDLGGGEDPTLKAEPEDEKDESSVLSQPSIERTDSQKSEKSKKLKDDLHKDTEFMDFSVLAIAEESQLNCDVSKHKRSLSKKGSLALRRKPSRRAIHSSGSDGDDALYQDSTEPKPPVVSDDEDDSTAKSDESKQEVFGAGSTDMSAPMGGSVGRGPFKPPITGGVKIPGLLEGLKKSKSFKSPESKKIDTTSSIDAKKAPEKEEINFRSLLKSTPSSSTTTAPSKSFKDSQNQNIAQAPPPSGIVKPSDLRKSPMAGSIKLPALVKPSPPSDKATKPLSPALSARAPPPVASKPKPPPPTAKPRLSPIIKSESINNSTPTSSITSSTSSSPVAATAAKSSASLSSTSSTSSENKKITEEVSVTSSSLSSTSSVEENANTTNTATAVDNNNSSLSSSSTTNRSTASSPSTILSSIRPKPYAPPKPKPRPTLATKPTSTPNKSSSDSKLSSSSINTDKPDAPTADKIDENSDKKSSTKDSDLSELISTSLKQRSSSSSPGVDGVNGQDSTDSAFVSKPRKSSISGISSVQSPIGPDRTAPRKSSISGSAYAPMGFRKSSISSESDGRSEPPSADVEGNFSFKARTSSIAESSAEREKDKDEESKENIESKTEKGQKSNGTINTVDKDEDTKALDKDTKVVEDKDSLKPKEILPKDNRVSEKNAENTSSVSQKPDTPQKPMWGVQLRKVDKKPATPSKPAVDNSKEAESPANWRQQLANKRKSITPKDTPPKEADSSVPEWAKASMERRKRLMESGVIKSDAK